MIYPFFSVESVSSRFFVHTAGHFPVHPAAADEYYAAT